MQIYLNFAVTLPDKRSFGMDLSTRASGQLHKCRENDTIYVLKQQSYFCCMAAV